MFRQVSYTSDNLKEIRDLKTNVLLGKERYTLLVNQFETANVDFVATKRANAEVERQLGLMTDKADALHNEKVRLGKILNVTAAAKLSSDHAKKAIEELNEKLNLECQATKEVLKKTQATNTTLSEKLVVSETTLLEKQKQEEKLTTKFEAKCCEIASLEAALEDQATQVKHLYKRITVEGGGGGGGMPASVNFDMKKEKSFDVRSSSSQIPRIGLDDGEEGEDRKQSEFLAMLACGSKDQHEEEVRKKDHKIKKLEEKLRRSQAQTKDALDRVWQLEKVRLDEAAGAIPLRK